MQEILVSIYIVTGCI